MVKIAAGTQVITPAKRKKTDMEQKFIKSMTGYKATNSDMTCKGHKFELGKWYEHQGEIKCCPELDEAAKGIGGFHFCISPSGVYAYYKTSDVRVFKCEAEQILEVPTEAGADFKLVAKRIRLVEEITPGSKTADNEGDRNTGYWNTGYRNTGYQNTGNRNTGNRNTGDQNTGNQNTGNRNTGYQNTGYQNTGNWNTGDQNTGDQNTGNQNTGNRNTGNRNTGYRNTGDQNTGNRNTGNWNTTNFCAGFFCSEEPKVISFDVQTDLTHEKFLEEYPEAYRLGELLSGKDEINFGDFENIPGITEDKLNKLHAAHLAGKQKLGS